MSEEKSIEELEKIVRDIYWSPRQYSLEDLTQVLKAITELKGYRKKCGDLIIDESIYREDEVDKLRAKLDKALEGLELADTRITELEENDFLNSSELTSIRAILKEIKEGV